MQTKHTFSAFAGSQRIVRRAGFTVFTLGLLLIGGLMASSIARFANRGAQAAALMTNFTVNSTADGTLAALAVNTTCDLREAIAAANTNAAVGQCPAGMAGMDTITFAPNVTGTITLSAGELLIGQALTITGPGAGSLTISGNQVSRVFNIAAGNFDVTLSGLTIANGQVKGADVIPIAGNSEGGGIRNASIGTVEIANCTLSGNSAIGGEARAELPTDPETFPPPLTGGKGNGGGIFNADAGTIRIINSTLTTNSATGGKAGVFAYLTGGDGNGGGIFNAGAGMISVINSTLTANSATGGKPMSEFLYLTGGKGNGGGIFNAGTGTIRVVNSTLTANYATGGEASGTLEVRGGDGNGGGIFNAGTGRVEITTSTVSGNSATGGNASGQQGAALSGAIFSGAGNGGGILVANTATVEITNSTVSGNSATGGTCFAASGGSSGPGNGGGIFNAGAGTVNLLNSHLTGNSVSDGDATGITSPSSGSSGGGIFNAGAGTVSLTTSTVSGNVASTNANLYAPPVPARGGGIFTTGTLTLINSVLNGNSARADNISSDGNLPFPYLQGGSTRGGGIFNGGAGRVHLLNSRLSANSATGSNVICGCSNNGGNSEGGGIFNTDQASVKITDSTLSGNFVTGGSADGVNAGFGASNAAGFATGGGIFHAGTGMMEITNSTLSGNSATGGNANSSGEGVNVGGESGGGGIYYAGAGTVTLTSNTLSENFTTGGSAVGSTFPNGNQPGSGNGGGISNSGTGVINTRNTIIAGNTATTTGPDVFGAATSQGFNLIGNNTGATLNAQMPNDQVGVSGAPINPLLGPLQINGSFTQTRRPLPGSPAIDKGNSFGLTTDQRGFQRPLDNPAIPNAAGGDGSDIGAVELFADSIAMGMIPLTIDPASNPAGAATELITAINQANEDPAATTIKLLCGVYTLTQRGDPNNFYGFNGLPAITSNVIIEGNGAIIERSSAPGTPTFRLFAIARQDPMTGAALATPGSLTLRQVTLRGGLARGGNGGDASDSAGGGGAGLGGAVYNQGILNIEQSALTTNTAQGGNGGNREVSGTGYGGGGGLGGNGGTSFHDTEAGNGGGGFGGDGALGADGGGRGGGEGGGRTANGNPGIGNIGGTGGSTEGGDGGNSGFDSEGKSGGFGGGAGGGAGSGDFGGGRGGIGGGGGGGGRGKSGGDGGFGGGGGGGFNGTGGGGGNGGFGGGGGGGITATGGFGGGSNNGADGGGGAGLGGAIFNDGGTLNLSNSTLSGNIALGGAGGASSTPALPGSGLGGGIFARNGSVTINHVTLNNNTAAQGGGSIYLLGDGETVYLDGARTMLRPGDSTSVSFNLRNSIFANTPGGASDAFVNTINGGAAIPGTNNNNLAESNGGAPGADANDLPGVTQTADPLLGALTAANCASGGCRTPVHPLTAGSPAINSAGAGGAAIDQCGTTRPPGTADIGAFESNTPPVVIGQIVTLKAGSNPVSLPIATVSDADQAPNTLNLTINGGSSATSNGITVTGLNIDPSGIVTAQIGTTCATMSGSTNFALLVTDNQNATGAGTLTVHVQPNTPPVLTYNPQSVVAGTTPRFTPSAGPGDNGTFGNITLTSITPATGLGLNVNPASGAVSVTGATLAGNYTVVISVTDNCGAATNATFTVNVTCPAININPASLPGATVNTAYPQTLAASPSGTTYSFALTGGLLPAGLSLNNNGSFSGAPTQSGVFNFRVTATGFGSCSSFRDYVLTVGCPTITVNPATLTNGAIGASYNQTISATPAGAYSFSVTSGALPPGLMLNAASGLLSGTPTQSGTYNFRITASADGCAGGRDYTVSIGCPAVTLASLGNATAGTSYSGSVAASPAGSYTYSLTAGNLHAGLTLNPSTGAMTGLPTVTGSYNFTVKAQTPNGCSATQSYTLTVACPAITLSSLPSPTVNSPYNQTVTASPSGGSYGFAVTAGALPTGLSLNPATGVLSGTPAVGGTFNFTITASGFSGGFGGCAGARAYSLTLGDGGCPTITLADLPGGQPGQLYNASATASPSGSYSYAVTAGSLPPGVTLYGSLGMLFGYPTTAGTFNFTITATGSNNCTGSKAYSVQIGGAALRSLVFGDFDGDGKADLSVWRGASGEWLTINSSDGQSRTEVWGTSAAPYFDVMTPGDFDGDGRMDAAVFRRGIQTGQGGEWLIKRSSDGAVTAKVWGVATDVPVPDDYDGDGKTDLAVWRGEQGNWYILRSSDNQTETVLWGTSNAPYRDLAVPADFDGDGRTDIAVFRQQNGHWYIRQSSDGSAIAKHWGLGTDVPVAADYDGDGKADIAVWRGSDTNWHILRSSDGMTQSISWGASTLGDWAVPGDFDGDGKADVAVWRALEGVWYVQFSGEPGGISKALGRSGDIPINRR